MLSLNQIKKIDPTLGELTEEDAEKIRHAFYELAQLIFEDWYDEKNGSKNPRGLLTIVENQPKM